MTFTPALEKGIYSQFRLSHTSYKRGSMSRINNYLELELPNNSVLHMIDHLLDPDENSIIPNLNNPLIRNERYMKFMDHYFEVSPKDDPKFPVTDSYRFMKSRFINQARSFFQQHKDIKRMISVNSTLFKINVLSIFNYNALLKVMTQGRLARYRQFDIILRSILHNVSQITGKHNYILIPVSNTVYTRAQFLRTFKVLDASSLRIANDFSYFFLIHLFGLFQSQDTTSLFKKFEDHELDTINIILACGDNAIIYNLGDLKSFMDNDSYFPIMLRHVNTLKLLNEHDETTLNEADDAKFDKIVASKTIEEIPEEVLESSDADKNINNDGPGQLLTDDTADAPIVKEELAKQKSQYTSIFDLGPKKKPGVVPTLIEHIDTQAQTHITENELIRDSRREKVLTVAEKYKTVEIGGKVVGELLNNTISPMVSNTKLTFLEDGLIDKSMAVSHIASFDKTYIKEMMVKDTAAVLTSFSSNGMFLTDVEERDELTPMDRIRHHRVTFEDVSGRKHKFSYKFPIVDDDGVMLVNGIESRMTKQQVNLPICKISPTRVSLASNYNKTIVERIDTNVHNFGLYLSKYIASIQASKAAIEIHLGHYESKDILPYDYTCLADKYSRIMFGNHKLVFDYPNRFIEIAGASEAYSEEASTMSSNGKVYSITTLLRDTTNLPVQQFKVKDLEWITEGVELTDEDKERIAKADLNAPILVALVDNKPVVIDGFHRLLKAIEENKETIIGKFVNSDMLAKHEISNLQMGEDALRKLEATFGVYCGTAGKFRLFYGSDNKILYVDETYSFDKAEAIIDILAEAFPNIPAKRVPSEWTELKIQDKNFPLAFILGFKFGLGRVIKKLDLEYTFIPKGEKHKGSLTDIFVPFKDGILWFNRYPLEKSLIISGLLKFDTTKYTFSSLNLQDTYYTILSDSGLSMNYLKGINSHFNLFIDPITRDVLIHMHEPTEFGALLLRANQMLSTSEALPSSSMANHRVRGYERFNSILYNQISRALATYQNQRLAKKPFSINPSAVFQSIMQDSTITIITDVNPIHDIKSKNGVTYSGQGGRTAQSFVVKDRVFPDDATGILSESTLDSGKVAINTYFTADPKVQNIRGMFNSEDTPLKPAQMLSAVSMLLPFSVNDDGKRANYSSIQLTHHVPSNNSETMRVRTGFEKIIAHRTGETFACPAARDGIVESINDKLKLVKIRYNAPKLNIDKDLNNVAISTNEIQYLIDRRLPIYVLKASNELSGNYTIGNMIHLNKTTPLRIVDMKRFADASLITSNNQSYFAKELEAVRNKKDIIQFTLMPRTKASEDDIEIFKFGDKYSNISGSFIRQEIVLNVKAGDTVKAGDIIAYNSGFFEPDEYDSNQVNWKHGIAANIVLMECDSTYEDSNAVSREFSEKLMMSPAHMRTIKFTSSTVLHEIVNIGDHVQTTDYLCVIEDSDIDALTLSDDPATVAFLTDLNRKAPKAKYHGTIAEIDVVYSCALDDMHPTVKAFVEKCNAFKIKLAKETANTSKAIKYPMPTQINSGTKYMGMDIDEDTIMILITITDDIPQRTADKLVVGSQLKSVTATVIPEPISTESGIPLDVIFSGKSIQNRITNSPLLAGTIERVLEKLEMDVVAMYFS